MKTPQVKPDWNYTIAGIVKKTETDKDRKERMAEDYRRRQEILDELEDKGCFERWG